MVDEQAAGDESAPFRCPWCSAVLPAPDLEDCPSCGATLTSTSEAALPGVTSIDHEAIARNAREAVRQPRSRLFSWLSGDYVTVVELSPDEKYLYYLPGAHGGAFKSGTPVIQYEIATGRRKVLAFLAGAFEGAYDYVPAGTYGMKVSADGGTLYVNFNGHAGDRLRPAHMKPNGFGLCAFAAIHIPESER